MSEAGHFVSTNRAGCPLRLLSEAEMFVLVLQVIRDQPALVKNILEHWVDDRAWF